MKKPKEIYVCRHSGGMYDGSYWQMCYWLKKNDKCQIDRKPCDQVTYVRKDEKNDTTS